MAQMYTDRVLFHFNGVNIFPPGDGASFSLRKTGNAQFVQGMTTSGDASGAVKGNNSYTLEITQFMQNNSNQDPIDFSKFDYELNNVQITISRATKSYGEHTYEGKQIILNNVFYMDSAMNGAGQGQPITSSYTFGAISEVET